MADVYDDMPPLVERPPPPPPSFILPPIDDKFNDDDLPPLVERPAITDADLPPLVVNPKSQSRWEYISDEPLEPASGPVRTTKEKDTATSAGPPKPPNAFILFRASFVKANPVPREAERDHATLSKIIGLVWRGLDSDEKVKWEKRAGQAREEWRAKNPDWRFSKAGNGFSGGGGKAGGGNGGSGGGGGTKAKGTRKKKKGPQKERCEAIAGLIQQGIKDGELANAIQNWDAVASPSPPPVEAPRKKPKNKTRMAPYVRMLSFDEEVKPEPVDSPAKPSNPLPTVYRESPVPEIVASTGQDYSYSTNVSGNPATQYQSLQGYQFGSFSVHSSPATSALAVEPGSPAPVNNAYTPTSPLANAYSSPAPVSYDAGSFPTTDANGYADAYYADRRSSYSSTFSGQDTPVTPNFFSNHDQAAYSAGYGGYSGNGYQQTIASNYAYSAVSPPGSPAAFALPDSALGHTSSYSTLSGWNGAPAPTDANTGVRTANTYYTGVFNANPHSVQPPDQPPAQAYGGVFSAKNVDPTTFTAKAIQPVMLPTKHAEPAVYDAGAKSLAYPVYQAPYDAGVHNWGPPGAAWASVGYAYA